MLVVPLASGAAVHIGSCARENSQLTRRAHPQHTWLHLHNRPSAHAVLACAAPTRGDIMAAASALKERMGCRQRRVPVEYCLVRHVHACAEPGEVEMRKRACVVNV